MIDTYHIAVDLGGTNIRTALFRGTSGKIENQKKVPTGAKRGLEPVLESIRKSIEDILPADRSSVEGIGIGVPGPCDPRKGIVVCPPNLPGWTNVPLTAWLEERLKIPVYIGNDANLAALGEWKYGAGVGSNDIVYFTISTGIGSGIISGGHLLVGANGLAGELGHLTIVIDGPPCPCGGKGHLEAVASGPSIARRARQLLKEGKPSKLTALCNNNLDAIDAALIAKAAKDGDALAKQVYQEAGTYLGIATADMLAAFNPSIVIFGGGVSNTGALLLDPVREAMEKYCMDPAYTRDLKIVTAQLGDDCGLFGAYVLSVESQSKKK